MEPLSQYGFHRRLACRGRRRHMQSGGGRTACHKTATERGTKTQWEHGKVQQKETKATELGRGAGPMASVSLRRLHGCRKQCSMPSTAPRSRAAVGPPCVAVRPPTPRKGLRHIARRAAAHSEDLLQVCILARQLQQHGIVKVLVDGHLVVRKERNERKLDWCTHCTKQGVVKGHVVWLATIDSSASTTATTASGCTPGKYQDARATRHARLLHASSINTAGSTARCTKQHSCTGTATHVISHALAPPRLHHKVTSQRLLQRGEVNLSLV